ncbi:hypothetical protein EVAR_14354_1 [Eumeta japonica]|uniref:Uncharacterized protein n=1 Tax=Eumeta variegata TaxID=151549 RepID=A0A4C1TXH5_EUMVA|nr:hypothetical protein EVAR_14354_1 [Eumeta japonica]
MPDGAAHDPTSLARDARTNVTRRVVYFARCPYSGESAISVGPYLTHRLSPSPHHTRQEHNGAIGVVQVRADYSEVSLPAKG